MEYSIEDNDIQIFNFNHLQTQIRSANDLINYIKEELEDKSLSEKYTDEIKQEFMSAYDSIMFFKNIASSERKRAKDLKRWDYPNKKKRKEDPSGKICPDITNPHILEDMDYFRQAAIQYQKTGSYTNLYPNPAPYSDYSQHWKREAERCRYGMVRESDGEWIPGYLYFYWNYSPIQKVVKDKNGTSVRTFDFPNPYDGDYLFFHYLQRARDRGFHTATLKKRGCGFSFKGGSKLARNCILGEYENSKKYTKSYAIANEKEYLIKDGVLNKYLDILNFCAESTPFPSAREKDSLNSMEWKMGYKDPETNKSKGVQNEVIGVTLKNDAHRARGKRGVLFEWEEVGSFTNFLTAWGIARPSVEEDGEVFGLMNAYGTGGEEGADFAGLEEIFYRPKGYNILSMPNVFDKNVNGQSECAFFFPQYMNVNGKYDENGNSNVVGSLIQILISRINVKYNTSDPNAIVQEKAERPITPQEAIMRKEGSAFPVANLKEYLESIKPTIDNFLAEHYVGDLLPGDKNEIIWKPNANLKPIRNFPNKQKNNLEGAIEIFEMPKRSGRTGKVFSNRYIAGADPVDNDYTASGSLASIFIFDLWTDRIVAEYTGRPILASEFYDKCILLLQFYNAKLNYENNLKGLFGHFSSRNVTYLLTDTLQYLRDQEIVKSTLHGNRAKGTRTNEETIKLGKTLQRQWMLDQKERLTDEGDTIYQPNYLSIRSIAYIEECIQWNPDGNFDRVSAMDMVMLLREDIKSNVEFYKETDNKPKNYNHLDNDDIIDNNWQKYIGENPNNLDI